MTFVVTKACIGCKDTACAKVCPTDSFQEGPEMLYINPESCIDCEACVFECPVEAIYHESDLPKERLDDLKLNADMVKIHPVFA